MGNFDEVWFLVPKENLSNDRLAEALTKINMIPNAIFEPEYHHSHVQIGMWGYSLESSTEWDFDNEEEEQLPILPEGMGLFKVTTEAADLREGEEPWTALSQVCITLFDALDALVAIEGEEIFNYGLEDARELYTLVTNLAIFSKDVITEEEHQLLSDLFEHGGQTATGFWYRKGISWDDNWNEETIPAYKQAIVDIWRRDPRLHGGLDVPDLEEPGEEEDTTPQPGTPEYERLQEIRAWRESTYVGFDDKPPAWYVMAGKVESKYGLAPPTWAGPVPGEGVSKVQIFDLDPHSGLNRFVKVDPEPGGAFIWVYYPLDRHTYEACHGFITEMLLRNPDRYHTTTDENRRWIDTLARALHAGQCHIEPVVIDVDDEGMTVNVTMSMVVTSGLSTIEPFAPSLGRQGSVGLLVTFLGESGEMHYQEHRLALMHMFERLSLRFGPVFGFGGRGFNRFVDMYEGMAPPEGRYWPYTIYDLQVFSQNRQWCREFVNQNPDDWMFWVIEERYGALLNRDLSATL